MKKTTIAPVHVSVTVRATAREAFRLFTEGMGSWWPLETHSVAADTYEGKVRAETVVFEPRAGGRIYERIAGGRDADWGVVLVWDPPSRVVFSWKPNLSAAPPTEVDVRFTPDGRATRVDLEHRGWERLGEHAIEKRRGYQTGWPGVLNRFVERAESAPR
jgi:uncharacterized protein YndB with AHSA1/START domain